MKEKDWNYDDPEDCLDLIYDMGICDCANLEYVQKVFVKLLDWADVDTNDFKRESYDKLFNDIGVFYVLNGILDKYGFLEHGGSASTSWLTGTGDRFLTTLKKYKLDDIDNRRQEEIRRSMPKYNKILEGDKQNV